MNITINGTICSNDDKEIYDWLNMEAVCPRDVDKALAGNEDVTLLINPGGGDVMAGNEIYSALKRYEGKVTAEITGYAASAATIIACGADLVRANPGTQYMIHNVSTFAGGDKNDMESTAQILKTMDRSIANIYRLKTGMEIDELLAMMDSSSGNMGKWMDAVEAKKYGFIDEIIGDNGSLAQPITIYNGFGTILGDEVKSSIRRKLAEAKERQKAQARLDLLKLKRR